MIFLKKLRQPFDQQHRKANPQQDAQHFADQQQHRRIAQEKCGQLRAPCADAAELPELPHAFLNAHREGGGDDQRGGNRRERRKHQQKQAQRRRKLGEPGLGGGSGDDVHTFAELDIEAFGVLVVILDARGILELDIDHVVGGGDAQILREHHERDKHGGAGDQLDARALDNADDGEFFLGHVVDGIADLVAGLEVEFLGHIGIHDQFAGFIGPGREAMAGNKHLRPELVVERFIDAHHIKPEPVIALGEHSLGQQASIGEIHFGQRLEALEHGLVEPRIGVALHRAHVDFRRRPAPGRWRG